MAYGKRRADEIYTSGPETLTARATEIVEGPVSKYSKQVLSTSQPPGVNALPLQWTITGRVDGARTLKGAKREAVSFTRAEQSTFIGDTWDVPSWELDYGEVNQSGEVVVFLSGDPANPVLDAVPSAGGELDLASLVRDVVAVQSHSGKARLDAWLTYLGTAKTDHGREAALRSLVKIDADWGRMRTGLDALLASSSLSDNMRAFTFGIVVFGLTSQKWERDGISVADFLGRQFESAESPRLAMRYILSLKLALGYTMEEAARSAREPLRKRIIESLKRGEATASRAPEIAEQYRQIRANYPGLF